MVGAFVCLKRKEMTIILVITMNSRNVALRNVTLNLVRTA